MFTTCIHPGKTETVQLRQVSIGRCAGQRAVSDGCKLVWRLITNDSTLCLSRSLPSAPSLSLSLSLSVCRCSLPSHCQLFSLSNMQLTASRRKPKRSWCVWPTCLRRQGFSVCSVLRCLELTVCGVAVTGKFKIYNLNAKCSLDSLATYGAIWHCVSIDWLINYRKSLAERDLNHLAHLIEIDQNLNIFLSNSILKC